MRVSIVTTTLNAMPYVVEATRSVLQTGYPNLEYIIIDAGSSDGTLDHINSLRDTRLKVDVIKGITQYEAIDLGFRKSTGDVLGWINGDDLYYPWTISCVGRFFTDFPEVQWITGLPTILNAQGECISVGHVASHPSRYLRNGWYKESALGGLQQESMFWRRSLYEKAGGLDTKYSLAADTELWIRMAHYAELVPVTAPLGTFRMHATNRSIAGRARFVREQEDATKSLPSFSRVKRWLCGLSVPTRRAVRLSEWHRTSLIYFSMTESRWKLTSCIRRI
jgi:hypothetical protein